jgi:hypothetical protein
MDKIIFYILNIINCCCDKEGYPYWKQGARGGWYQVHWIEPNEAWQALIVGVVCTVIFVLLTYWIVRKWIK